jgi:molecular chaperone GrpE
MNRPDQESDEERTPAAEEVSEAVAAGSDAPAASAESDVARLEGERDDWKSRALRAMADLENLKKRTQREREEVALYANQRLVLQLLPILDNLERALGTPEGAGAGLREGVDLVARQFRDALAREGVVPIEAVGQVFDPNLHEAVMQVESEEHAEAVVLEEFQRGYRMSDRVIRPSMVKVARGRSHE